ncbi:MULTISPECIES: hypothetical protein [unclassified Amycolatopsis]|uniref:hypothetical protein n=1 Tax=unclassified Amycolatopsis TaxID=2618356 RepID=UPI0028761590|nr:MULTISPECIES: hypothetical protein [unclassified Amycolatopsis]MDS0140611.1 hypothetical protein [Amycolatopsis sp. 505]MDS0149261.1 hypothetical protein [Amycolatopsis sp. CM201R]
MWWTRKSKPYPNAELVNALREAGLRAIWRLEQKDGPGDINPHTARMTSYALASMLTFSADGSPIRVGDGFERVKQMVFAGMPERRESRRDWVVWELDRLGYAAQARALADQPVGSERRKSG